MIRDIVGILGLAALGAGLWHRFAWDIAAIIVGVLLFAVAVYGVKGR